jgi:hypothetical protein
LTLKRTSNQFEFNQRFADLLGNFSLSIDLRFETRHYGHGSQFHYLKKNKRPRKTLEHDNGFFASLARTPTGYRDYDHLRTEVHDGFLVVLHNALDYPTPSDMHFYTETYNHLRVYVEPEFISTEESLVVLSPEE